MAQLNFNAIGHLFQEGLCNVHAAYETALASLTDRLSVIEDQYINDLAAVRDGADPYIRDDDGTELYTYEQAYEINLSNAETARRVGQIAFIVILHHFWERQCNRWMGTTDYKADAAYEFLKARGLTVDRAALEILRKACNTVKHDSQTLHKTNPELFYPAAGSRKTPNYEETLIVDDAFLDSLFDAVRNSGPNISSTAKLW